MAEYSVFHRERAAVDEEMGLEPSESQQLMAPETLSVNGAKEEAAEVVYIVDPEGKGKSAAKGKEADKRAKRKQGGTIVFLNGLRGLAALMVVEQHLQLTPEVRMGSVSVDVFYVLSAFLLTMLFERKVRQMLARKASLKQWALMLADYFSKRFFRVYPLVVVVAILLQILPAKERGRYYLIHDQKERESYDFLKVMAFETKSRFFVLWSLPIEIAYYFIIPVFVAAILALRRFWWLMALPLYVWIINEGIHVRRWHHQSLRPHLPTFVAGSLGAIVYAKASQYIEANDFEFKRWQRIVIRVIEFCTLVLFLSLVFRGLLFHGFIDNPRLGAEGFPFTSVPVSALIVIEMLLPSALSRFLEWNFLCYAGKVSFSLYIMHAFIIYNPTLQHIPSKYDRFFVNFGGTLLLATASYWAIEYPSQLMAQRISKYLARIGQPPTFASAVLKP